MKGDSIFTYEGDRTREDLVNFALRLMGPSVTQIENRKDFEMAKKRSELFFLFAGQNEGTEWEYYTKIGKKIVKLCLYSLYTMQNSLNFDFFFFTFF